MSLPYQRNHVLTTWQSKELTLTKDQKIEAFDLLTWTSTFAILLSIWQIIIPFTTFKNNTAQTFLAISSSIFLVISMVLLYWSYRNYSLLKKNQEEENPHLQTWHIEGTIYIISFLLIACFASSLVGIILFEVISLFNLQKGYSWAYLVANGDDIEQAQKNAIILISAQCLLIVCNIIVLAIYIRYTYYLEFFPKHLPSILGFLLSAFISMCFLTVGDQHFLQSYIGQQSKYFETLAESLHEQILWVCVICIIITLFVVIENKSIQLQDVPKVKLYYFPFLFLTIIGFFLSLTAIKFLYYAQNMNKQMTSDCKTTLQTFSKSYIDKIGCPSKYQMFDGYYIQDCQTYNAGIVWELDQYHHVDQKMNQISCLNLNCCHLIAEVRSLNYKEFFLLSMVTALIGWISAAHCFDLAMQEPSAIKSDIIIYSNWKFAAQIGLLTIVGVITIFFSFTYLPEIPETQFQISFDEKNTLNYNSSQSYFHRVNPIMSIPACLNINDVSNQKFLLTFDPNNCDQSIQGNPQECNIDKQGFYICLKSKNGVFQLDPGWDSRRGRLLQLTEFDPYILQMGLHGLQRKDEFCMYGLQDSVNSVLTNSLYVCRNPGTYLKITMKSQQQPVSFDFHQNNDKHLGFQKKAISNSTHIIKLFMPRNSNINKNHRHQKITPAKAHYAQVELYIYDAETYAPIEGATLNIYVNVTTCIELDQAVYYTVRNLKSDANGTAIIDNLFILPDTTHLFMVRADGYIYNCLLTSKLSLNFNNKLMLPLVKTFDHSKIKILLFHQSSLRLQLGGTFNVNENYSCQVGYFNNNCGGMSYSSDEEVVQLQANVISIEKLGEFKYLFYFKMICNSRELQFKINNHISLSDEEKSSLLSDERLLVSSQLTVNVYVSGILYPVKQYGYKRKEFENKQDLVYVLFCMDGSLGVTSQMEKGEFYDNLKQSLPNADLC